MEEGSAGYPLSRSQLKGSDDHRRGAEEGSLLPPPPPASGGMGGATGVGGNGHNTSTRMSERIHHRGNSSSSPNALLQAHPDGDVQALTLMLTNRLGGVVQEAASQLAETKQRLAKEHEDAVARALQDHQQQVVELKAYVATLHDELQQLQFKNQEAQRKSEVTRDRLVARLHTRRQRDAIQSAFDQWRWTAWASVSIRRAQEHAAGQLEKHRQTSRAWLAWAREQAQAKVQQLEANQKSRADQIVREVVRKYEEELNRLRQMLALKDEELTLEVKRREHLQEETRRAFLKTMTSLNLEAISMFGNPGASSPSPIHAPGASLSPPNAYHGPPPPSAPLVHDEDTVLISPPDERERPRPPLAVQPTATSRTSV